MLTDTTGVLDRFVFDTETERAIHGLLAAGLVLIGTTTYKGHVEELAFFTVTGVEVRLSFRHMLGEKPVRREVLTGTTD